MPVFVPNQTIETREPAVTVDAGLRPGRHRFRLVVVDAAGNQSLPAELVVTITLPLEPPIPIPPIRDPVRRPGG